MSFAYALYPESEETFSAIEEKLGALPARLADAKAQSPIAIRTEPPANSQMGAVVQAILTDFGFPVAAEKESVRAVCAVELTEHRADLPKGVFFTPAVAVTVTEGGNAAVFSYRKTFSRIGASTESAAKERMNRTVCAELQQSLPATLKRSAE